MIVIVGAALPTMWTVAVAYLAHAPIVGYSFRWCAQAFGVHAQVTPALGVLALVAATVGTARVTVAFRAHRRLRHDAPGSVEVTGHHEPFAFTLPGRGGHIVMSSGLAELLDDRERAVVLAHESAHARHRHDRRAGDAADPPPRRVRRRALPSLTMVCARA